MSDERYKILTSEMEFWQWAIHSPEKRVARCACTDDEQSTVTIWVSESGRPEPSMMFSKACFPLVTCEDEHGPISPPKKSPLEEQLGGAIGGPIDEVTQIACINTANWLVAQLESESRHAGACANDDIRDGIRIGMRQIVDEARRLIGRSE